MASRESSGRKWNWPCRFTHLFLTLTLAFSLLSSVHAQYFIINQPSASTAWANGSPFPVSWTMGLLNGIDSFDIELTRLSQDGLFLVAHNVPATSNTLNILLQDVPEADDYFLLCLNATHSLIHAVSSRFTVTNSSASQNPSPDPSAPTVTISGSPNPLQQFAATLALPANGGSSLIFSPRSSPNPRALGLGGILALCAVFLGGAMTLC